MDCFECKKPLGDEPKVTSDGNKFHSRCFTCSRCSRGLAGLSFYTVEGQRVCKECYADKCAPTCVKCDNSIIGASTKLGDGREFHPDCFVCHKCDKPISSSFKSVEGGQVEHTPDCNNTTASDNDQCMECKKRLVNIKFFTLADGQKVCSQCYAEKHAEVCHICQKPILEGQSHTVNDWRYHKECFVCPQPGCGKYLAGRKITLDAGRVVCITCNEE